ncbi:TetR/AcrR family transcriptional regulator [Novosphingobium sp. KN65.2]|uniref:TetR/AcrR family transcriptional regulator n=1 Tax=Novosphingobium sp. KN65.2 TaxID=1478134 RepID=UPI0005DFC996|nr:TetR/AcrR family transcriptional regulator [Novosphingobium sp. KN65.2]CDO35169.1 putative Transcriptional regulator, TetR family [Novosphingobium sp. KN65.2]
MRVPHIDQSAQTIDLPSGSAGKGRTDRWPELLEAAAELFAEKGYDGTSLRDIADRLGMLKGSLYHYISGKSDLLVHVMREAHRRGLRSIAALAREEGPAIERLEAIVVAHARYVCTERVFTAGFFEARRHLPEARAVEFAADERDYRLRVEALIVRGQDEGALRTDLDPKLTALCLLGFLNSLHLWVRPNGVHSIRRICDHAVMLGLDGLRRR